MNLPTALSRIEDLSSHHAAWKRLRSAVLRDLMLPDPSAAMAGPEPGAPLDPGGASDVSQQRLAQRVEHKRVLVTGGSSGIGLATAKRVAAAGAKTILCGRDPQKLAEAERQIARTGGEVSCHSVDLADLEACDTFVARLLEQHDGIDILINNAGRSIRRSVHHSLDRFHDFQRTMQLNYFGALRLTLGLLPAMARRRSGHVINISSIGVLMNAPRFAAYSASKAALDAWTRCAAGEYADLGVEFTTLYMPLVRTPMIAPTQSYDRVPALTVEQAAELTLRAIVERPERLATPLGLAVDLACAVAPGWMRSVNNYLFRSAP